jgi:uncharacterized protein (TIGR00251 family)
VIQVADKLLIQAHPDGLSFKVHVQPKSSRNRILGLHGEALKLKLTAPPVEGAANKACLEALAQALSVPKSHLEITAGQSSRLKKIFIRCAPAEAARIRRRLEELAGI